jgi:mono/diheme cytochrome c family protein
MKFLFGMLFGVVCVGLGLFVIGKTGIVNVAATQHGVFNDQVDKALGEFADHSISRHASKSTNPFAHDPSSISNGLDHYKENCVGCHAAKGVDTSEIAKGLNPAPPMLDMVDTQKLSDGELFWVVSNGIRSTGMPAFSPTHQPDEIWKIVAFVRHLPQLTDAEIAQLKPLREAEEHHHHDQEAHPSVTPAPPHRHGGKPPAHT